eukprot:Colp12_sorted_trinity150504_noHs@28925
MPVFSKMSLPNEDNNLGPTRQNFITSLWNLVNDPSLQHCVGWSTQGDMLLIHDVCLFQQDVMQRYFASTLLSSFQRQLNLYNFKKIAYPHYSEELPKEWAEGRFALAYIHPHFQRTSTPETLARIKRRK